jgi:lipopolysaccharide export system protein LptA
MARDLNADHPSPPRRVRRPARRPVALIACGLIVAGLLLVVLVNLDRDEPAARDVDPAIDTSGVVTPRHLNEDDFTGGARAIDEAIGELPAGGWIQVSNDRGELAQQYRFRRLDPSPEGLGPGWVRLQNPEIELYGSGGSVVRLTGESALAYTPNRAVESGTLTGDVVIRRFERPDDRGFDRETTPADLAVRTDEAHFDNMIGIVECAGPIHVETRSGEFRGAGLELLINDRDDVIQRLDVERVDEIRLARVSTEDAGDGTAPAEGRRDPDRGSRPRADAGTAPDGAKKDGAKKDGAKPGGRKPDEKRAGPAQFYLLTLTENVRVVQGTGETARTAAGDVLSITFSTKSEGIGTSLSLGAPRRRPRWPGRPQPIEALLAGTAFATFQSFDRTIAPVPAPDDTIITCDGGLSVIPIDRATAALDSARDARLELAGAPVALADPAAESFATCAVLRYDVRDERLELVGSETHVLDIHSPQLVATADVFWLNQRRRAGGFDGPGEARFPRVAVPDDVSGPAPEPAGAAEDDATDRLRITWTDHVDLGFAPAPEGAEGGVANGVAIGGLRSAAFTGDVHVSDASQQVWSEFLDVTLKPAGGDGDGASDADIERVVAETDVQVRLPGGEVVDADRVVIDGERRTAVLTGDEVRLVDERDMIDSARRIRIDDDRRRYVLDGPGRLRRFVEPILAPEHAASGERLPASVFESLEGRDEELRITWEEGVDVAPITDGGDANGDDDAPTRARFRGAVTVISPELVLTDADEMRVRFASRAARGDRGREVPGAGGGAGGIELIEADGALVAEAAGEDGAIRCRHLRVEIGEDEQGRAVPSLLRATGAVAIDDGRQHLWTETLEATFRPVEAGREPAADGPFAGARVDVDAVSAEGGVQILLAEGERVFADRLEASGTRETAELFGRRVQVVSPDFILDHGTHLVLDRRERRYRVEGGGVFHAFAAPFDLSRDLAPIAPPEPGGERTLEAVWTESAEYVEGDASASGSGGSLELRGKVHVESRPSPIELSTIDAETVRLDFLAAAGDGADDRAAAPADDPAASLTRDLARLVATGDAKLENRTWLDETRSVPPRVFHVAGAHIDYDQRTLEAIVEGDGTLLIRDEWDEPSGRADGFARRGTTLFRWQDRLRMTPDVDDRFDIVMDGAVECIHRDLAQITSTLTGRRLEATVVRSRAEAQRADETPSSMLKLGGTMTARRLYGEGGIIVRTPDREVACDEFDYNLTTGLAVVSAASGRTVSILTPESPEPLRHSRVLWDMVSDTITIHRGTASGAP